MTALDVTFRVHDNGLFQRLQEHGDRAAPYIGAAMRRSVFAYRREFIAGHHKANPVKFGRGRGAFNSPKRPNARPRNANSFLIETRPKNEKQAKLGELRVAYYTRSFVAKTLETGARINPRAGQWLAIPTGAAITPSGRTRRYWSSPAMLKKHRRGIKTKFARRRGSSSAMVLVDVGNVGGKKVYGPQRQGGRRRKARPTRWRIAWRLVKRARITPRLGFLTGWDKLGPKIFDERIRKEFANYLRKVWGQK